MATAIIIATAMTPPPTIILVFFRICGFDSINVGVGMSSTIFAICSFVVVISS